MRMTHLALIAAVPLFLAAQPAFALKATGEECSSSSECASSNCTVQEANCGKKVVSNAVTLAATGKRIEECQVVRATCAARNTPCAAHIVDGVIRYDCGDQVQ